MLGNQARMISMAMVMFALAAVGGSSASEGGLSSRGGFKPVLTRLWVGGKEVLVSGDTLSDRQYALDALALKYVGDYTNDPEVENEIRRGYWCATPVLQQMGKIAASERSESALRERARVMVKRNARPGRYQQ